MRKLLLTSIAFIILSTLLGFYAFRANTQAEVLGDAYRARQIEEGAALYQTHCANCHGVHGRAEECFDQNYQQIGCKGKPLNSPELFCYYYRDDFKTIPPYPLEAYISQVTKTGNENGMPSFGETYGGPLAETKINQIAIFISNWQGHWLYHCSTDPPPNRWPSSVSKLPTGNPENGEALYTISYGCSACHGDLDDETSNAVGPWLGDLAESKEIRFLPEDIYTDADHFYESTLFPSAHIAEDCPTGPCSGPPSSMPDNFGTRMYPQDMADIMSYLFGTTAFTGNIDFAEKHADHPELWQAYQE